MISKSGTQWQKEHDRPRVEVWISREFHTSLVHEANHLELSLSQLMKAVLLDRINELHTHFWIWPVEEQRSFLRGK